MGRVRDGRVWRARGVLLWRGIEEVFRVWRGRTQGLSPATGDVQDDKSYIFRVDGCALRLSVWSISRLRGHNFIYYGHKWCQK